MSHCEWAMCECAGFLVVSLLYVGIVRPSDALPANRSWQPSCSHGTFQHEAITSRSRQLLMMGTWLPETCWATSRREIKNTKSDILLDFSFPHFIHSCSHYKLLKLCVNVYGGLCTNYYVLTSPEYSEVLFPFSANPLFSVLLLWRQEYGLEYGQCRCIFPAEVLPWSRNTSRWRCGSPKPLIECG